MKDFGTVPSRRSFCLVADGEILLLVRSRSHESEHLTGDGSRTVELQDDNIW